MKIIIQSILAAVFLFTSCGGSPSSDTASRNGTEKNSSVPSIDRTAASNAEVKILHHDQVIASYIAAGPDAALDTEYRTIGLNLSGSDTAKQMLMIVVEEQKAGVYPLDGSWNGKDKLSVMFTTDALPTPSLAFDKGELNITELTDKYCSGTFKATGTAGSKKGYTVEAVFSKLPVVSSSRDSRN